MLNSVAAAAIKMTTPASRPTRRPNLKCNFPQINRFKQFVAKLLIFIRRMPASGRKFAIGSGGIMTDQTINILFNRKIIVLLFPTITGMTAGAPAPVRLWRYSEIINDMGLAQAFFSPLVTLPSPMNGTVYLTGCEIVTFQTGSGYLRP